MSSTVSLDTEVDMEGSADDWQVGVPELLWIAVLACKSLVSSEALTQNVANALLSDDETIAAFSQIVWASSISSLAPSSFLGMLLLGQSLCFVVF